MDVVQHHLGPVGNRDAVQRHHRVLCGVAHSNARRRVRCHLVAPRRLDKCVWRRGGRGLDVGVARSLSHLNQLAVFVDAHHVRNIVRHRILLSEHQHQSGLPVAVQLAEQRGQSPPCVRIDARVGFLEHDQLGAANQGGEDARPSRLAVGKCDHGSPQHILVKLEEWGSVAYPPVRVQRLLSRELPSVL